MWIGNYKITVKSTFSQEQKQFRHIDELKIKKKQAKNMLVGPLILSHKLDLKAANLGQTTHKVSSVTLARMRAER